jgi:hypothetical protein
MALERAFVTPLLIVLWLSAPAAAQTPSVSLDDLRRLIDVQRVVLNR